MFDRSKRLPTSTLHFRRRSRARSAERTRHYVRASARQPAFERGWAHAVREQRTRVVPANGRPANPGRSRRSPALRLGVHGIASIEPFRLNWRTPSAAARCRGATTAVKGSSARYSRQSRAADPQVPSHYPVRATPGLERRPPARSWPCQRLLGRMLSARQLLPEG